jgi:hypothetical protein
MIQTVALPLSTEIFLSVSSLSGRHRRAHAWLNSLRPTQKSISVVPGHSLAPSISMLESMEGLTVTPLDCAGNGDRVYISWETTALIGGEQRTYLGVDRFRIREGMAIEEQVIFDTAVLQTAD